MPFGRMGARGGFGRLGVLGGTGNPVTPYLGQVATRAFIPNVTTAFTGTGNARTAHYARDNITSLKIAVANFWVNAGVGETNNGGTQTTTASVEYPAGTFTQIKWSGSTSVTIADGATSYSDFASVSIPKGALFWIRRFLSNSVNLIYTGGAGIGLRGPAMNVALGDAVEVSATDKTMSGTVVDGGAGSIVPVSGILGMTRQPSIAVLGSSRWSGFQDLTVDATGDTGYSRMIGGSFGYMNFAVAGDTTAAVLVSAAKRFGLITNCTHLWLDPGLNDLNAGTTAATVLADLATLASVWPGGNTKIIFNDEAAWTTSTDGWITTANQTVKSWEAQRVLLNSGIDALSGFNQIVKLNNFDGNGTNKQFWNNPVVGGSQFTPDGTHENTATNIAIKNAGLFNPALVRLP